MVETLPVNFKTEHIDSSEIELGEQNVAQEGKVGEETITYSVKTNLFSEIFGLGAFDKKEIARETTEAATERIVHKGTRRYQYMMCSDGSYRYYTDDQFKQKYIGFTSKSEDACAKNNQGTKTHLADTAEGARSSPVSNNRPQAYVSPAYKPPVCTKVPIPFSTYYRYVNYLSYGVQELSLEGKNGYKETCVDGNTGLAMPGYTIQSNPQHAIYNIGRGNTPLTYQEKRANYDACMMAAIPELGNDCHTRLE